MATSAHVSARRGAAVLLAAGVLLAGACGGGSSPASGSEVGRISAVHKSVVTVAGVSGVGSGTEIDRGNAIATDDSGVVDYTLQALSCKQDIDTTVVAQPDSGTVLTFQSGNPVVCDTARGASRTKTVTTPNSTITMADPVFSVWWTNGATLVRVYRGEASVASSTGAGSPVTVGAWQETRVAGSGAPQAPGRFGPGDVAPFELAAVESIMGDVEPTVSPSSSTTKSGLMTNAEGFCVTAQGEAQAVVLETCVGDATQQVAHTSPTGQLQMLGMCLATPTARLAVVPVVLSPCSAVNTFWVVDGTQVVQRGGCLDDPTPTVTGSQLVLAACSRAASQRWNVPPAPG